MEFWPENQGQSPLYSKFGTIPGRDCAHNYHDRHQATNYPLYYGEHQDQSRECSYWTVPGSRTGGAPQEYTNWTDQELAASSHFPFILDRHAQQHPDLGVYQAHESRDREWTASQRAAREYERGFLREGWQRRWEPCSQVRYNREVSTKRSDSSYRELEAWAARYSHSLPRRRRIEAELRGASQGLLESSRAPERDSRSGTDPRVAALQQVIQSSNVRESGLWDRGGRQQAPAYYPPQTSATDTSHMLDMKEKTGYQRRMFSQPPGYIAPPPYNSPHKNSPVLHQSDTSWEQEGKRQAHWSQLTLGKQGVSADLQVCRKVDKEDFTKPDLSQCILPQLGGLKQKGKETEALQVSSPITIEKTQIEHQGLLSLQPPQVLHTVQNNKMIEESKVIEGRKFRLNKKTGGMTIFCLVSRIADPTETPSLPLFTTQTNIQNTGLGGVSMGLSDNSDNNETNKQADEVDFKAPALTEQPNTPEVKQETPTCIESEKLEDQLKNRVERSVSPEKVSPNVTLSTIGRQVAQSAQPVSAKYPLWREPSVTSRAETECSSTCLKANSEDGDSNVLHNQEDSGKVQTTKDTDSEDNKGLLVPDTTCVVVKMELIPSPKKEHVHFVDSTPDTEQMPLDIQSPVSSESVQSNSDLNQCETTDQNTESDTLHIIENPETEPDPDVIEKQTPEGESYISFASMPSSSVSEKETLEERAERILGIPLHDSISEQQADDAVSLVESCVSDQEVEPSPIRDIDSIGEVEEFPKSTTEEEEDQSEVGLTEDAVCLQEKDDAKDQVANEAGEDLAGLLEQESTMSGEVDIDSKTSIKTLPEIEMTEDPLLKSASEEGTTEHSEEESHPVENDATQCVSPPSQNCEAPDAALSLTPSSPNLTSPLYVTESNTDRVHDPELIALSSPENTAPSPSSSLPHTPSQELPSPLPPGSIDFSPSSTPQTDHFPSPLPLDLKDQTAEEVSDVEAQDKESEKSQQVTNQISNNLEDLTKEPIADLMSQQLFESGRPDGAACVKEMDITDEQQTKEADEDTRDHTIEQILENPAKDNILQQQLECLKSETEVCVQESCMAEGQLPHQVDEDFTEQIMEHTLATEVSILEQELESCMTDEQLSEEVSEDTIGLLEQTIPQENKTESQTQTEVNILQQQEVNDQEEEASCLERSDMTEKQSHNEADVDSAVLLDEKVIKENATDSQTQIEVLQDTPQAEPLESCPLSESSPPSESSPLALSDSDCEDVLPPSELPSPSHASQKSDAEFVTPLEIVSVCHSSTNPVAGASPAADIPENVAPPLHLDSCEESLKFSSSSSTDSPALSPLSSLTYLPQGGNGNVSSDLPLREEPQYPKSLWDAVNRIRKHTAPDSENEEEEVSELWDPESVGEHLGCQDVVEDRDSEKTVFDETEQHEVPKTGSVWGVKVGQIQQDPGHEGLSGHVEEDTLSCSSTSSHSSGDTVIIADEDNVEDMPSDAMTERETKSDEEFQTVEGERSCCGEVKHDDAAKEEENGDERIRNQSSLSEEGPAEVANITIEAADMMEVEPKANGEEVFVLSRVSDEEMNESECGITE